MKVVISLVFHPLIRRKFRKPPTNPTHSTNPSPGIRPNPIHHITGDDFVGLIWSFSPGVGPFWHQTQQIICP
jgi:hypothetical protein